MREKSIDIVKGIAIFSMIIGHSGLPELLHNFIYMFQVSAFFICSGYCLKDDYFYSPFLFIKRKITGLYIPYIAWSLLFLVCHSLFLRWHLYDGVSWGATDYSAKEYLERVANILFRMEGHDQLLGGFWFMKSLFIGNIIAYLALKYIKKEIIILPILFVLTIVFLFTHFTTFLLHIDSKVFFAASYVVIGFWMAHNKKLLYNRYASLLFSAIVIVATIYLPHPGFAETTKMTFVPYFFISWMAVYVILHIGKWLEDKRISALFNRGGYNSLIMLALHFIAFKIASFIITQTYHLEVTLLSEFPVIGEYAHMGWWVAYSIIGCTLPLLVGEAIGKIKAIELKRKC